MSGSANFSHETSVSAANPVSWAACEYLATRSAVSPNTTSVTTSVPTRIHCRLPCNSKAAAKGRNRMTRSKSAMITTINCRKKQQPQPFSGRRHVGPDSAAVPAAAKQTVHRPFNGLWSRSYINRTPNNANNPSAIARA